MPFLKSQPLEGRVLERGYVGGNRLTAGTLEENTKEKPMGTSQERPGKGEEGSHALHIPTVR